MLMQHAVEGTIDAGEFSAWLQAISASLRGQAGIEVPCGDCVGCCVSSYYIPLRSEDRAARARVPATALASAPDQPAGQLMIGYGPTGECPMLEAGRCTIYADRPQTCRDYDCRIFAAAGIEAGGPERRVINQRVHAWRFSYRDDDARRRHDAVRAAAAFIRDRWQAFPGLCAPTAPTGIAVLALKAHAVFLDPASGSRTDAEIAQAILRSSRE